MSYLETLLRETFEAQGNPNAAVQAREVYKTIRPYVDEDAEKRGQIRADPSTDYKLLTSRYHCSPHTVYRAWAEILPARETK